MRGKKVEVKCERCKTPFLARVADRKRGWGRFCSKSCKAVRQEQRTGQYAALRDRQEYEGGESYFADAHLFDNCEK